MIYKGRFRTVRHKDHAVPIPPPRPLLGPMASLDVRAWPHSAEDGPLLLVTSPKKTGGAVARNRFRRRVRRAFEGCVENLRERTWAVWVRPGRAAGSLDLITLQDIQTQLRLALCRHSAPDTP